MRSDYNGSWVQGKNPLPGCGVSRRGTGVRGAGDFVPCIFKFLAAAGGESKRNTFEVMNENTSQQHLPGL